jgi:hypothetical protein
MSEKIEGTTVYEHYGVLIAAKLEAETTDLIELRNHINYSFSCSTLGTGEEILVEIYDVTKNEWQPYFIGGSRVKLAQNYQQLHFEKVSALIRFVKPVTVAPVGLFVSHPQ